jgi:hypothetical protein
MPSDANADSADQDDLDADLDDFSDATIDTDIPSDASTDADLDGEPLATFRECRGRAFEASFHGDWRHPIASGARALGQAGHSVTDEIFTTPAALAQVEGKFAYGVLSLDLEDEEVTGFVDDCRDWLPLGDGLTDSDGRLSFEIPPELLAEPGRYEVIMVVQGDGTMAIGTILVVPPESSFVVFDIDGTLTTSDSEMMGDYLSDLFGGDYVPEPWPDARSLVARYHDAGYLVIYLTGRPYWLDDITREWLSELDFAQGTLHLARDLDELMPNNDSVGAYKLDYLLRVLADHRIVHAYGNAPTDIFAYQSAGIADSDIFIIGDHAGENGTQPVSSYSDHLSTLSLPTAEQPFSR